MTWSTEGLHFSHPGATRATLDDVSISIPPAKLTALLGPNGAGKSTLLSVLLGTTRVTRGVVRFAGRPASEWSRTELARRIGVLPQREEFAFPLSVRTLVEMGRYPHIGPWQRARAEDTAAVHDAIARCSLSLMAERAVSTLSGGELQRARLARALAQIESAGHGAPASALVLDEPTAALDLAHEMAFFQLVRELARAGTTVLLVTHNLNLAARFADHLILLNEGKVAAAGTAGEVLTADRVSHAYGWPVAVVPFAGEADQLDTASTGADVKRVVPQVVSLERREHL